MKLKAITSIIAALMFGTLLVAQTSRPLSPPGTASVQVSGTWVKSDRQAYTMGGEKYQDGKWIDITYGRPLVRGRKPFTGTGSDYGKSTIAQFQAPLTLRCGAPAPTCRPA